MKLTKRHLILVLFPLLIAIITYAGLAASILKAGPLMKLVTTVREDLNKKEKLHYIATGDSLTEGVGDQIKQGGFVPLAANDLKDRYNLIAVETENYGVNGERSDRILRRVKTKEEIRNNIKTTDFITLIVGGNNLMKVIQNNSFGLTVNPLKKPLKNYQENVTELLEESRSLSKTASIYILGIYNSFYLNLPEIIDMQTIVNNWNKGTETVIKEMPNCYFIPIDDLLYQGLNQEVGVTEKGTNQTTDTTESLNGTKNNVLHEEDHFHPNNLGYQLMANVVRDQLIETQNQWLEKEDGQ